MKTFKQAVKRRDTKLKELRKLEAKVSKLRSEVINIEHRCSSLQSYGDKFERAIDFSVNFSGYED